VSAAKTWGATVLVAATLTAAGCGSSDGGAGSGDEGPLVLELELSEENGSGQGGRATFTSLGVGRTRIVLELTNPPPVPQPAHVHSGSCGDLGQPVIALTDVEGGRSVTVTETPFEELQRPGLVIHAHKSEAEYDVSVACAPLAGGS
jgi:hypothetical protein